MSNAMTLAKELQTMQPTAVIRDERVKAQFISVYNSIWNEGGDAVYEREAIYFNRYLRDSEKLRKCTGTSTFYAFIDLAVRGLTLEPGAQAVCYLVPRSIKVGKDQNGNDVYESICNLTISGYGELILRARAGQIRHADNPVIVYEGDTFQFGEQNGQKVVNYMCAFPRTSDRIVACFLKITRPDGSIDYAVMQETDWLRLKGYSEKNNTYYDRNKGQWVSKPNALYGGNGQIDTGFLMAKCIKHAFKTYPKLPIGRGTSLESEVIDQPQQQGDFNPYGGVDAQEQRKEEHFAPQPDMSAGVSFDPAQQGDDDGSF